MKYGRFDVEAGAYVVERPDTPRPWSNYLGSADFGSVITNNAAGYTFYRSAAQGRLTRYFFNAHPPAQPGKYVYLRDAESGDFWSTSWQPVAKPLDQFASSCRHAPGRTTISSTYAGIESEVRYFIPMDRLYEVWSVTVTNRSETTRRLSAFPFIEPQCNWNDLDDTRNLQYNQYISMGGCQDGVIDIGSNVNMPVDPEHFQNKDQARHTFMALAGAEPAGYDTDLAAFLGPYGTYAAPRAVAEGSCSNSDAYGDMPCAVLQADLELAPGKSRQFAVFYGVGAAAEAATAQEEMGTPAQRDAAWDKVRDHWLARTSVLSAETPDPALNAMVNLWAPYNNLMTFYWSRTASLVYAGERDGLGYRDTVQDIVGAASLVTEEARERLELMITGQCSTGGAVSVVKPFAHQPGSEPLPDGYRADDGLWLFNAVPAYVKETGDLDFYRKVLPYADEGEAAVLAHLRRAIEFNLERSGAHDLPCGLQADWNDCVRLGDTGESVFVAMQLRLALREYDDIARRLGEPDEAAWAQARLRKLDNDLEKHTWDGEWYLRAYRHDGLKFGSKDVPEGQIFMNPQTWAVLSGHATGARATQVLDSMWKHLDTPYGIMVCAPPYVTTDPKIALGRLFNPGCKENAGVFNHTQGWAIMAEAAIGRGDRAWDLLSRVMPAAYNDQAEVREVEPYVVCQSTHSRFSPHCGKGRVSWLSGSAVWNYVAMTQAVLGIQPEYDGLRIDPCIPSTWEGFKVVRRFRGKTIRISVSNPDGRQKGVTAMVLNGETVEGNLLPAEKLQAENGVEVTL